MASTLVGDGGIKALKAAVDSNTTLLESVLQTLQTVQSLSLKMERRICGVETELDSLHTVVSTLTTRQSDHKQVSSSHVDSAVPYSQSSSEAISTQLNDLTTSLRQIDQRVGSLAADVTLLKRSGQVNDLKVSKLLRISVHGNAVIKKDLVNVQENSVSVVSKRIKEQANAVNSQAKIMTDDLSKQINELKDCVDEQLPHVDQVMLKKELGEQFSSLKNLGEQQLINLPASDDKAADGYHTCILRNAIISKDGIVFCTTSDDSLESISQCIAAQPFTQDSTYFSIEIISAAQGGAIVMGGCPNNFPPNVMPGWIARSNGYHTDDGGIYVGFNKPIVKFEASKKGDILTMKFNPNTKMLSFVRNGGLIYSAEWTPTGSLYPAIGMLSPGDAVKLLDPLMWGK